MAGFPKTAPAIGTPRIMVEIQVKASQLTATWPIPRSLPANAMTKLTTRARARKIKKAAIKVHKNENPTTDELLAVHEEYKNALQTLYNEYNPVYGDKDVKLVLA